jgi:hypothetical protein
MRDHLGHRRLHEDLVADSNRRRRSRDPGDYVAARRIVIEGALGRPLLVPSLEVVELRVRRNVVALAGCDLPLERYNPILPRFYGLWSFSKNKPAARSLLEFLAMRQNAEKQVAASQGYDIPPYPKFTDFKTWDEEGPPKGTLSHYPIKGGDQVAGVVCSPAPPLIAAQIWAQSVQAQMVVRYFKGEAMDKVLDRAEREIEGFKRT